MEFDRNGFERKHALKYKLIDSRELKIISERV